MISDARLRAALPHALLSTDLTGFGPKSEGKVRDSYLQGERRLLITSDRVSAFDRVIGAIPYKGQVLNQLAAWCFEQTADIVGNHILALPDPNALIAREAKALPVEVVVRGYITGVTSTSLWTLYSQGVPRPYGLDLPPNLPKNSRLSTPVITPTTKAEAGQHDAPLSCAQVLEQGLVEPALWEEVQRVALALFQRGTELAARAGLILVDTKYEFGLVNGKLVLIDEVHTPDSSRYWKADTYLARLAAGQEPEGLDKEYLRRWLNSVGYAGEGPPPALTEEVTLELARRYIALYEQLTGREFVPGDQPVGDRLKHSLRDWTLRPLVVILMGSKGDLNVGRGVADTLTRFGVDSVLRVGSAHKVPRHVMDILDQAEADPRPKVYVTIAGRSNALSAFVDAYVASPVIACPPYSDRFGGADLFSSLRMPSGVAPAVVIEAEGAALLAAKMLGLRDPALRQRVARVQAENAQRVLQDDHSLREEDRS